MIKRILNQTSKTITSAAIIVAVFSVLSRAVGFIRDRILAGQFGAGEELDVYFAAFRIPDLMFQMIVVGALSASFIPLFAKYYRTKGSARAWRMTNTVLNAVVIFFAIVSGIGIALADYIAPLIAIGFEPELQAQVADLSRVMFGAQIILAISMVFGSVLQSVRRFFLYSLSPIFYNIGIISGAVFLAPQYGVMGVAYGVLIGACLHLLVQAVGVFALGYKYQPILQLKSPEVKYILKHMPPRVMGLAVNQVNFLLMTVLASLLGAGSVTILQFAYNLNFFPIGVIGVSFGIAAFPAFCEYADEKSSTNFISAFSSTVRQVIFFILPATVLFILMRAQIVRAVVGAGEFDWPATIATANLLGLFAISLFSQALVYILIRAFFAKQDTMTPFWISLMAMIVNIVGAWFLTKEWGSIGFGVSFSVASIIQLIALWSILQSRLGNLDGKRIVRSTGILLVAATFAGVVIQLLEQVVVLYIPIDTFLGIVGQITIAGGAGMLMYGLAAYLMRSEEMIDFLASMKKRLLKRAKPEEPIQTT